jgi:flavin-dependent dehydrogenase
MQSNVNTQSIKTDVLVIGGGTAGTMAGIKAKQANPDADVLILEKANIRRSGAIARSAVPKGQSPWEWMGLILQSFPDTLPQNSTSAKSQLPMMAFSTKKPSIKQQS